MNATRMITGVCLLSSLFTFPSGAQVKTGIDVLEAENFASLKRLADARGGHLRLAVLTNPVGIDAQERRTIDVLRQDGATAVPGLEVVRLFSAEHGITASVDRANVADDKDAASGLPIVSVYGSTEAQRHPSAKQLAGLDAVLIDLQDVGARWWTFQTLTRYFLQASAANHVDIILLDRPNPLGGEAVQGPLSTPGRESYVNPFPEPMRPGMTLGELAGMFNGEAREAGQAGARLTVIKMQGWNRGDWWDDTGLLWVNPSPNLRSLTQVMVYPGMGLLEVSGVNVKGPAEPPFLRFGAPWIKATTLAAYLNGRKIPGVSFFPVFYTPPLAEDRYPYRGERVEGVEITVNDRRALDPTELGVECVAALWKLYPKTFQIDRVDRLMLNHAVLDRIKAGDDPRAIAAGWQADLDAFKAKRSKYLLY